MQTASMPVLTLSGDARNRGRIHGESLRAQIADCIEAVKENIGSKGGLHPDQYLQEFVTSLSFWHRIDAWLPGFKDEIVGIAEAAGRKFFELAALNLLDEEAWFGRDRMLRTATPGISVNTDRCSVIAVA